MLVATVYRRISLLGMKMYLLEQLGLSEDSAADIGNEVVFLAHQNHEDLQLPNARMYLFCLQG